MAETSGRIRHAIGKPVSIGVCCLCHDLLELDTLVELLQLLLGVDVLTDVDRPLGAVLGDVELVDVHEGSLPRVTCDVVTIRGTGLDDGGHLVTRSELVPLRHYLGVSLIGTHGIATEQVFLCLDVDCALPAVPGELLATPFDGIAVRLNHANRTSIGITDLIALEVDAIARLERTTRRLVHRIEGLAYRIGYLTFNDGIVHDESQDVQQHVLQIVTLCRVEGMLAVHIIGQLPQQLTASVHVSHAQSDSD